MKGRLLVTGFGPFGQVESNPSEALAKRVDAPHQVLEVSFSQVDDFFDKLDRQSFDVLLMLGLARGRQRMTPEFFARNAVGSVLDVAGESRFGLIDPGFPLLLNSTLWTATIVADWTVELPVRASFDAGSYVCNYMYFRALEQLPDKAVGFLHVPATDQVCIDEQEKTLAMMIDRMDA